MGIRNQEGGIAVEGALSITLVIPLLLGLFDLIRISFVLTALNFTVSTGQRWAVLNQQLEDEDGPDGSYLSRVDSINSYMEDTASKVGLKLLPSDISICQLDSAGCLANNAGAPNALVQITAATNVPTFFIGVMSGAHHVRVTATGIAKNEPSIS